jgi:hypothetical protein
MITYSVFRLAARRTVLWVVSAAGMRAGERKTGWTKPLPPSPGLWALNAPGRLARKQMLDPRGFERIARCFRRARYSSAVSQFHALC